MKWSPYQNLHGVRLNHPPPQIPLYVASYFTAFFRLNTCRYPGYNNISPIPFTAICDYADRLRPSDPEYFINMIMEIDRNFVHLFNEQKKE